MRNMIMSIVIGLGLAVGFGAMSNVNACDDCETIEEFAMHVRDTHIERDLCTEEHTICMECDGYFCDNLTCWCGREISIDKVMTYEQLMQFEQAIYDIYCEEYCTNYCEECGVRYYKECMCEALENGCGTDCEVCSFYDYELFIDDHYLMILDIYVDVVEEIQERVVAREKEETVIVIYEF